MDKVDKQMESRVWQRVRSRETPEQAPPQRDNLKPWILAAQENATACRNLSLQLIGKQWESLRRLEQENLRLIQCLKGIARLRGEDIKLTPLMRPSDQPRRCLEKCLNRQRTLWKQMQLRQEDPEFGMVFSSLRRRNEDLCAILAELVGKLET